MTVVVGCTAAILVVALKKEQSIEDLAVILGSVASLISVIIVLPSKIAENLFPSDGEKDFATFFINTHRDDINIAKNRTPDYEENANDEEGENFDSLALLVEGDDS